MTLWIVIVGFIIGFALAFSIGANDVANSFGTSVGSKVLTLVKACILASIFEMAGAILIGAKVSNTISKGIIEPELYNDDTALLELGYLSALIGACIWLLTATVFKLPVSGTHSIVGAVIGFTLVAKGSNGVQWWTLAKIVGSWFISPVFSGAMSAGLYFLLQFTILKLPTHLQQLERGILLLPVIYAATFSVNSFSVFHDGPRLLYFHLIPLWGAVIASIGIGLISAILARWLIGPRLRRHIMHRRPTLLDIAGAPGKTRTTTKPFNASCVSVNNCGSVASLAVTDGCKTPNPQLIRPPGSANFFIPPDSMAAATTLAPPGSSEAERAIVQRLLEDRSMAPSLTHSVSSLYLVTPFVGGDKDVTKTLDSCDVTIMDKAEEAGLDSDRMENEEIEYPGIFQLFAFLQVLTACFGAFAHGGNDVSNAIGPVVGLYGLHMGNPPALKSEPQLWILAIGGVGISIGLWVLGRRVIETVGTDLSEVTPPSGFCIELGAATTVLIASQLSVPVSTTHCKIGSVVFVGLSRGGRRKIDWRIFRNIIIAWLVTVPASGLISAGVMFVLKTLVHTVPTLSTSSLNGTNSTNATTIATTVLQSLFLDSNNSSSIATTRSTPALSW